MLIGVPDLEKRKKVIENRDKSKITKYLIFISHVNKISISPATIATANTVTRLS